VSGGHSPHLEHPDEVPDAIASFIERIGVSPPRSDRPDAPR
jgi:hypothetical protein